MSLLQEGQIIHGTYTVERFLGQGAFAEVYRVQHEFLQRQALKVFKMPGTIEDTRTALDEALTLSRIGHRNIIRVFNAGILQTAKGTHGFFTMEYVAGGSLQQFWQSFGDKFVPVEDAVNILRQVCQGLSLAHLDDPPIVHRDIKPQNILVGYDNHGLRACVSDFGLAKRVNPLLLLLSARGTRCFKAPETFVDPKSDSCAGDVWALGLTLYLLLTDRFPYSGGDLDELDFRSFSRPLMPPSRFNIEVDQRLDEILLRALAVKRAERYQNAKEMLDDLNRWKARSEPAPVSLKHKVGSFETTKDALGKPDTTDEKRAREIAAKARRLARDFNTLAEAADLMEEAFIKWPSLREEYESSVKQWRCGIIS